MRDGDGRGGGGGGGGQHFVAWKISSYSTFYGLENLSLLSLYFFTSQLTQLEISAYSGLETSAHSALCGHEKLSLQSFLRRGNLSLLSLIWFGDLSLLSFFVAWNISSLLCFLWPGKSQLTQPWLAQLFAWKAQLTQRLLAFKSQLLWLGNLSLLSCL